MSKLKLQYNPTPHFRESSKLPSYDHVFFHEEEYQAIEDIFEKWGFRANMLFSIKISILFLINDPEQFSMRKLPDDYYAVKHNSFRNWFICDQLEGLDNFLQQAHKQIKKLDIDEFIIAGVLNRIESELKKKQYSEEFIQFLTNFKDGDIYNFIDKDLKDEIRTIERNGKKAVYYYYLISQFINDRTSLNEVDMVSIWVTLLEKTPQKYLIKFLNDDDFKKVNKAQEDLHK